MPVRERLLQLDAERYKKGDLPVENLIAKYCSYAGFQVKRFFFQSINA